MYNMSVDDALLIAKIIAYAMGDSSVTLTELDKNATKALVKKIADQRYDWLPEHRERFKMFADAVMK